MLSPTAFPPKRLPAPMECPLYLDNIFDKYQALINRRSLSLLFILAWLLLATPPSFAAVIRLGTNCSLANAIRSANGDAQVAPANQCAAGDSSSTDFIDFVADVEITEALPAISSDIHFWGRGFSLSVPAEETEGESPATYDFSLLTATNGEVHIYNLTLSGAGDSALKAEEAENSELTMHISSCEFLDNTAAFNGGAIALSGGASVGVFSSTFSGNDAPNGNGGAIYAENSWFYVHWSKFSDNSASLNGGAIYFENSPPELYKLIQVEGNSFKANEATESGGAVYVANTGETPQTGAIIADNSFSEHKARDGGAIYIASGKIHLNNNTIDENVVSGKGGGVYLAGGPVHIRHSTVVKNQAANGGGIAIFTDDQDSSQNPRVNLYNSIVADNTDTDTTDTTCFRDALNNDEGNIIDDSNCAVAQTAEADLLLELVDGGATYSESKADRYYRLLPGSSAIDTADGRQGRMLSSDQIGIRRPQGAGYDIGAYEFMVAAPESDGGAPGLSPDGGAPGSGLAGGSSGRGKAGQPGQLNAMIHTCGPLSEAANGITIEATYGLESGVQCQEIGAAGIGLKWIIDAGFIKAVDIWAYVEQGVQACFEASGPLLFLDATTVPRRVMSLESFILDGKTCASINRPGSIVLRSSRSALGTLPVATIHPHPASTATPSAKQAAPGCKVTTTESLNFRAGPGITHKIFFALPASVTLTVLDRTSDWYKVDWYGAQGWISADYVNTYGICG